MYDLDTVLVRVSELRTTQESVQSAHARLQAGFDDLTAELTRTLAEWGDDTESRAAYAGFTSRVNGLFAEMTTALAKMPPAIAAAADSAEATERANAARWSS